MNDKTIINNISKIHFILISTLSFIFLILFTIFILLKNGIYIDDISFQNIKAKKLYIKWDEKISLVVKELKINNDKKNKESKIDYSKVVETLENSLSIAKWFKLVSIDKIYFNDISGSFEYTDDKKGFLSLYSKEFTLKCSLGFNNNKFKIDIDEFSAINKDIKTYGKIVFDTVDGLIFSTDLNVSINKDANLHIALNGNNKKVSYNLISDNKIKDIKYIIDIFNIAPNIKYWFYDAMKLSGVSIESLNGWFNYDSMNKAYLNLHVIAEADNLIYTYNKKLPPVRTKSTNLEFINGVLNIKPTDAYTYNFFLDKSWLNIDFSKNEELLTLYLLFDGQLNKNLLSLLNVYNIELPFVQTKGDLASNLKLDINLRTRKVTAIGDFYTKEALINYSGLDIDILDAHVFLNNSHVRVDNMLAKYKDIATSHVDLDFNAKDSNGTLDFRISSVSFKELDLELNEPTNPLRARYTISQKQDYIRVDKSNWKYKDTNATVDLMKIPFDRETLTANIPDTLVDMPTHASAFVSGRMLFNPFRLNLDADLLKLSYSNISLNQSTAPLKIFYDNKITIISKDMLRVSLADKECRLNNFAVDIEDSEIILNNIELDIDNTVKSKISAKYSLITSSGYIDMHNVEYLNNTLGEIFRYDRDIGFNIVDHNNKIIVNSKYYDLDYIISDDEWILNLNSIENIANNSLLLKKYSFDNGSFSIYKKNSDKNMKFFAKTKYKYKFLVSNNKAVSDYFITGEIDNDSNDVSFKINDNIDVKISKNIEIKADGIGININPVLDFFADMKSTVKAKKINLNLNANNSFIYLSENRYAISDKIKLQYFNDVLSAQLKYKDGKAGFKLSDSNFHLYGSGFNDKFMEKLFALSKFKGGTLTFLISGTTTEYDGIFYAKDTTIVDYKILNNVLAFVNTIPSLVTFSLPGYSKKGLEAQSAYMKFKFKDDVYKFSDLYVKSKEIDIIGTGEASIVKNTIDLDLNLVTDLASSASKIPIVGYILFGKENVSTSLTVTGALNDPDVNTQIAKSIIVAPFNIIKRTLMFPFELFNSDEKE